LNKLIPLLAFSILLLVPVSQNAFAGGVCFIDSDCTANDGNQCTGPVQCIFFVCVQPPLSGNSCNDGKQCTGNDVCVVGSCLGRTDLRDGQNCGSSPTICSAQDTCFGGTCFDNNLFIGTLCFPNECRQGICTISGTCEIRNIATGAACGDGTSTECNLPDTCNSSGFCESNVMPSGTACGDSTSNECTLPDICSNAVCIPRNAPAGFACGDSTNTSCNLADTCTGTGICSVNFVGTSTSCEDGDQCTGPDNCDGAGACAGGPPITGIPACFPGDGGTVIGGEIIPIDSTSLILVNTQTFSWMIPVVLSGMGIGLFVASRKSE